MNEPARLDGSNNNEPTNTPRQQRPISVSCDMAMSPCLLTALRSGMPRDAGVPMPNQARPIGLARVKLPRDADFVKRGHRRGVESDERVLGLRQPSTTSKKVGIPW